MATKSKCCSGKCSAKPLRFQYGKRKNGQWYWHVRAANSEIVAHGEGYKRVAGVLKVYRILFGPDASAELEQL